MFYATEAGVGYLRCEAASDLKVISEVVFDMGMYLKANPCPVRIDELKTVVGEGLGNAIRHGNRLNKLLHVVFVFRCDEKGYDLVFENSGSGFDWQKYLPDERAGAGGDGGLRRIAALGYRISFNPTGTILDLRKEFAPPGAPEISGSGG